MWVFNVFLLLTYSFCSPLYEGLVAQGASWYVAIPSPITGLMPLDPAPEFVPAPRVCVSEPPAVLPHGSRPRAK
jgi:hypothetical protein